MIRTLSGASDCKDAVLSGPGYGQVPFSAFQIDPRCKYKLPAVDKDFHDRTVCQDCQFINLPGYTPDSPSSAASALTGLAAGGRCSCAACQEG